MAKAATAPVAVSPQLDATAARLFIGSPGKQRVAMATMLTPGIAVACSRVIEDSGREISSPTDLRLEVEAPITGSRSERYRVEIAGKDPATDSMFLKLSEPLRRSSPPGALTDAVPRGTAWSAVVWDQVVKLPRVVSGTVDRYEASGSRLILHVDAASDQPVLASGAPVVADGKILGMLGADESTGAQLLAIPMSAILRGAVAETLGFRPPPKPGTDANASTSSSAIPGSPEGRAEFLARCTPAAREALGHADGIRRQMGQKTLHMEQLIGGLMARDDSPLRAAMARLGVSPDRVRVALTEAVHTSLPDPDGYAPSSPPGLAAYSKHIGDAFAAAQQAAAATNAAAIDETHLVYGALSISECSVIRRLQELGIRRGLVGLEIAVRDLIAVMRADTTDGSDLLGLEREVNALAAVIAAQAVTPPLSVGLFGDWGSGKSFFMEQLQQAVARCAKRPVDAGEVGPYCQRIVQIKFNAWTYMDTDLWASLAAEIFEKLAEDLDAQAKAEAIASGTVPTRERLLAAAANTRDVLAEAERRRSVAEQELQASEQRLRTLNATEADVERGMSRRVIMREALKAATSIPAVSGPLKEAGEALRLPTAQAAATEVRAQLLELTGALGYVRGLVISLRHGGRRVWLLTLLLVLLLAVGIPLLTRLAVLWNLPRLITALTGALVTLGAFLTPLLRKIHQVIGIIEQARTANRAAIEQARQAQETSARQAREGHRLELEEAQQRVEQAQGQLKQIETALEAMRADRQVCDFIRERYQSSDYTKCFGTIAKARGDFERLVELFRRVQKESPGDGRLPRIDRIVLYIDDLDRCPEDKVVAVLQAVHLLLAMPLFVVVVGVDSRWLVHSLRQHSAVFREEEENDEDIPDDERVHWQSTPLNYLEKIFQIPFTLRPMEVNGYRRLIEDLAQSAPDLSSTAAERETASPDGSRVQEPPTGTQPTQDLPAPAPSPAADSKGDSLPTGMPDLPPPSQPASRQPVRPEFLKIEEWEREAMKRLFPLIPSPRSAKRYVNVYRLLRATIADEDYEAFIRKDDGHYRVVLLLLAMLTGHPAPTTEIIRDLLQSREDPPWWSFLRRYRSRVDAALVIGDDAPFGERVEAERWRDLWKDLEEVRRHFEDLGSIRRFREWARHVARYSFQSGRVLLEEGVEAAMVGGESGVYPRRRSSVMSAATEPDSPSGPAARPRRAAPRARARGKIAGA